MKNANDMIADLSLISDYVRNNNQKIAYSNEPIKCLAKIIDLIVNHQMFDETYKLEHINANAQLIAEYPDLFDSQYQMTGPTCLLFINGKNRPVAASSKAFNYRFDFSLGDNFDLTKAVKCVGQELADEVRKIRKDAGIYCPYIPIEIVRCFADKDFTPQIGFKTRYAHLTKAELNA